MSRLSPSISSSQHVGLAPAVDGETINQYVPPLRHHCLRRDDYKGIWNKLTAWSLLLVHLLWALFVAAAFLYINNKTFRIKSRASTSLLEHGIYQSDMVTIISILLVITKLLAGTWQALCVWRCIFVLLEKDGIYLKDINQVTSLSFLSPFKKGSIRTSTWRISCALVLILTWPAQLSNPIASGSISWVPATAYEANPNFTATVATVNLTASSWDSFDKYWDIRQTVVKNAAGRAANALNLSRVAENLDPPTTRLISPAFEFLAGSEISNVIAPQVSFGELTWVTGTLPGPIEEALYNSFSGYLNFTSIESPLLIEGFLGNAAILNDSPWELNVQPTSWQGTFYAALMVDMVEMTSDSTCMSKFSDESARIFSVAMNNDVLNCFIVAEMVITAGVGNCKTSQEPDASICAVTSPEVATLFAYENDGFSTDGSWTDVLSGVEFEEDPLMSTVLAMMPEVMQALTAMAGIETIEGHIEDQVVLYPEAYLKNIIAASCQGTWSALTAVFASSTPLESSYQEPVEVVNAEIALWRVAFWLLLNILLTLSGCLLCVLQFLCDRDPVVDKIIPAFFLDNSLLLNQDTNGLCNATKLGKGDANLPPLKLRKRACAESFRHDMLAFEYPPQEDSELMGLTAYNV